MISIEVVWNHSNLKTFKKFKKDILLGVLSSKLSCSCLTSFLFMYLELFSKQFRTKNSENDINTLSFLNKNHKSSVKKVVYS